MQALTMLRLLRLLRLLPRLCAGALLLALAAGASGARAADAAKYALVIGNSEYGNERGLPNAANDARLMARTLTGLGFAVTAHQDLGRARFAAAVEEFAARLPAGATAFVYYAGHGMQLGGSNYLNPVDMPLTGESGAKVRAYALNTLLERLAKARSTLNIVVLDACRNNPFQPGGATRYRSFRDLGLAQVDAPRGTFIAYSTSPGQLAPDGAGANSVYTATLAKALAQPGRELEAVFRQVGNDVRRQTRDDQIPWYESSLAGAYYLHADDQARQAATAAPAPSGAQPQPQPRGRAMRGLHAPGPDAARDAAQWYRQLGAAEWSQVDWDIQQRVRRLTPDELPALRHQAAGGSVVAQTVLGLAYREGVEPLRGDGRVMRHKANNTLALTWLRKAAQAGFPVAQAELGEMYYQAHGLERNLRDSMHWLELAAAANYPRARLDLLQVQAEAAPQRMDAGAALRSMLESLNGAGRK